MGSAFGGIARAWREMLETRSEEKGMEKNHSGGLAGCDAKSADRVRILKRLMTLILQTEKELDPALLALVQAGEARVVRLDGEGPVDYDAVLAEILDEGTGPVVVG